MKCRVIGSDGIPTQDAEILRMVDTDDGPAYEVYLHDSDMVDLVGDELIVFENPSGYLAEEVIDGRRTPAKYEGRVSWMPYSYGISTVANELDDEPVPGYRADGPTPGKIEWIFPTGYFREGSLEPLAPNSGGLMLIESIPNRLVMKTAYRNEEAKIFADYPDLRAEIVELEREYPAKVSEQKTDIRIPATVGADLIDRHNLGLLASQYGFRDAQELLRMLFEVAYYYRVSGINLTSTGQEQTSAQVGIVTGNETSLFVPGKTLKEITAQWAVVSAPDLIASHVPNDRPGEGFAENASYPAQVQERDYQRDLNEADKVRRQARQFRAALVVNTNPDAVNGAPIVTRDMIVLGGNSRVMTMQLLYQQGKGQEIKKRLGLLCSQNCFGVTEAELDLVARPVLVRMLPETSAEMGQAKLREFVRALNVSLTQELDRQDATVALARVVPESERRALMMQFYQFLTDVSLPTFISRYNAFFSDFLFRSGLVTNQNVAANVVQTGERKGELTPAGEQMVESVLFGVVFEDDPRVVGKLKRRQYNATRDVLGILIATGAKEGYSLIPAFRVAMQAANEGKSAQNEGGLFAQPLDLPVLPKMILYVYEEFQTRPAQFRRIFLRYLEAIRSPMISPTSQAALFASVEQERLSPEWVFAWASGLTVSGDKVERQSNDFAPLDRIRDGARVSNPSYRQVINTSKGRFTTNVEREGSRYTYEQDLGEFGARKGSLDYPRLYQASALLELAQQPENLKAARALIRRALLDVRDLSQTELDSLIDLLYSERAEIPVLIPEIDEEPQAPVVEPPTPLGMKILTTRKQVADFLFQGLQELGFGRGDKKLNFWEKETDSGKVLYRIYLEDRVKRGKPWRQRGYWEVEGDGWVSSKFNRAPATYQKYAEDILENVLFRIPEIDEEPPAPVVEPPAPVKRKRILVIEATPSEVEFARDAIMNLTDDQKEALVLLQSRLVGPGQEDDFVGNTYGSVVAEELIKKGLLKRYTTGDGAIYFYLTPAGQYALEQTANILFKIQPDPISLLEGIRAKEKQATDIYLGIQPQENHFTLYEKNADDVFWYLVSAYSTLALLPEVQFPAGRRVERITPTKDEWLAADDALIATYGSSPAYLGAEKRLLQKPVTFFAFNVKPKIDIVKEYNKLVKNGLMRTYQLSSGNVYKVLTAAGLYVRQQEKIGASFKVQPDPVTLLNQLNAPDANEQALEIWTNLFPDKTLGELAEQGDDTTFLELLVAYEKQRLPLVDFAGVSYSRPKKAKKAPEPAPEPSDSQPSNFWVGELKSAIAEQDDDRALYALRLILGVTVAEDKIRYSELMKKLIENKSWYAYDTIEAAAFRKWFKDHGIKNLKIKVRRYSMSSGLDWNGRDLTEAEDQQIRFMTSIKSPKGEIGFLDSNRTGAGDIYIRFPYVLSLIQILVQKMSEYNEKKKGTKNYREIFLTPLAKDFASLKQSKKRSKPAKPPAPSKPKPSVSDDELPKTGPELLSLYKENRNKVSNLAEKEGFEPFAFVRVLDTVNNPAGVSKVKIGRDWYLVVDEEEITGKEDLAKKKAEYQKVGKFLKKLEIINSFRVLVSGEKADWARWATLAVQTPSKPKAAKAEEKIPTMGTVHLQPEMPKAKPKKKKQPVDKYLLNVSVREIWRIARKAGIPPEILEDAIDIIKDPEEHTGSIIDGKDWWVVRQFETTNKDTFEEYKDTYTKTGEFLQSKGLVEQYLVKGRYRGNELIEISSPLKFAIQPFNTTPDDEDTSELVESPKKKDKTPPEVAQAPAPAPAPPSSSAYVIKAGKNSMELFALPFYQLIPDAQRPAVFEALDGLIKGIVKVQGTPVSRSAKQAKIREKREENPLLRTSQEFRDARDKAQSILEKTIKQPFPVGRFRLIDIAVVNFFAPEGLWPLPRRGERYSQDELKSIKYEAFFFAQVQEVWQRFFLELNSLNMEELDLFKDLYCVSATQSHSYERMRCLEDKDTAISIFRELYTLPWPAQRSYQPILDEFTTPEGIQAEYTLDNYIGEPLELIAKVMKAKQGVMSPLSVPTNEKEARAYIDEYGLDRFFKEVMRLGDRTRDEYRLRDLLVKELERQTATDQAKTVLAIAQDKGKEDAVSYSSFTDSPWESHKFFDELFVRMAEDGDSRFEIQKELERLGSRLEKTYRNVYKMEPPGQGFQKSGFENDSIQTTVGRAKSYSTQKEIDPRNYKPVDVLRLMLINAEDLLRKDKAHNENKTKFAKYKNDKNLLKALSDGFTFQEIKAYYDSLEHHDTDKIEDDIAKLKALIAKEEKTAQAPAPRQRPEVKPKAKPEVTPANKQRAETFTRQILPAGLELRPYPYTKKNGDVLEGSSVIAIVERLPREDFRELLQAAKKKRGFYVRGEQGFVIRSGNLDRFVSDAFAILGASEPEPEPEQEPATGPETYHGYPILTSKKEVADFLARGMKERGYDASVEKFHGNRLAVKISSPKIAYQGLFVIGDDGLESGRGFWHKREDKKTFMMSEARIVLNDAIVNIKGDFSGEVDPGRIGNPPSLNKTPALPHERIHGGKNRPGIASRPANVDVGATMERQLRKMQREHNAENPDNKVTLKQLKSVCHRGRGAYSTSHRPGVSRDGWCIARVKAFLHLVATGEPRNPAYTQDNDLIENNPAAVPPLYMQRAAQLSLALSERFPNRDGMTRTGKEQRRRIAAGIPLSEAQVKKLYSFLSRSAVWADAAGAESRGFFGDKSNPSRGYIAILGWGGDGGERARNWAERQLDKWEA